VEQFVARQPILDRNNKVQGYELLARSGPENFFKGADANKASAQVIAQSANVFGLESLAQGKRLFVNVTKKVLVDGLVRTLPSAQTVVELLESVPPDEEVIRACQALKQAGYQVALDDYVDSEPMRALVSLADVVKIDFRAHQGEARRALTQSLARPGLTLLAEKIETRAEHDEALQLGYQLFQGYWYQRPEMISAKDLAPSKLSRLQLMHALNQGGLDFDALEKVLKHDVALSVKLLKYLNSASFGFRGRIRSVRHALVLMGEQPFRRWASLLTLADLSESHPPALLAACLLRANFCEALAPKGQALEYFLTGLLSCIDTLMGRPMSELTTQMMLPLPVKQVLEGDHSSAHGKLLDLALACEQGDWVKAGSQEWELGLDETKVKDAWLAAVRWADQTMGQLYG
jgi:EAL and modified HD-GYP domain-containing signal transduction protein